MTTATVSANRKAIAIEARDGSVVSVQIDAERRGWAMHPMYRYDGTFSDTFYTITHVASGMAGGTYLTRARAVRALRVHAERFPDIDIERMKRVAGRWRSWFDKLRNGHLTEPPKTKPTYWRTVKP